MISGQHVIFVYTSLSLRLVFVVIARELCFVLTLCFFVSHPRARRRRRVETRARRCPTGLGWGTTRSCTRAKSTSSPRSRARHSKPRAPSRATAATTQTSSRDAREREREKTRALISFYWVRKLRELAGTLSGRASSTTSTLY